MTAHKEKLSAPQRIQPISVDVCTRDGTVVRGLVYEKAPDKQNGLPAKSQPPLLCLPGELRTVAEYDDLAQQLLSSPDFSGPVYMMDLRGRGQSDFAPAETYSPVFEAEDVIAFCDACELHCVTILASARSAFIPLLIAPARPSLVQALIYNDGAPEHDGVGIARMKNIFAQLDNSKTVNEGAKLIARVLKNQFPAFNTSNWMQMAKYVWGDDPQRDIPLYDKKLPAMVHCHDFDQPQPALWPQFAMFATKPALIIRGEHSPIITKEIVGRMETINPRLIEIVAEGQGHVPLIDQSELPGNIPNEILAFLNSNFK